MARNSPVKICVTRHSPNSEPKFHHAEMLLGAGKSTNALLAILINGWVFRVLIINFFCCSSL